MENLFISFMEFLEQLSGYVTFGYLLLSSFGALLLIVVGSIIRTQFTYEVHLLRNITKLNRYFINNPYINDDNLIVFNRKMKKVPRTLRYSWQEFMLNRDKAPSEYMNTVTCVDQPSKASAYGNVTNSSFIYTVVIALTAMLLALGNLIANNSALVFTEVLFRILLIPIIIAVLGLTFVVFMRARHTSIVADLYFSFHEFERNINKACTTLPQFIDYEVLFTKREIKEGIPVLQEYLEKRALQEKLEQEEMMLESALYEQFDFSEIGVENSLLLERAMRESEKYFKVRNDLSGRIKAKETEMLNYQKGFDEVTKDYERKAQALRETLTQLTDQINNTTIKIEANYMKRRYVEEQQRLQQLEKEYELATNRFQKQQTEIQGEIDSYKSELDRRKQLTQEAMVAEGKTYASKVYTLIAQTVQEQSRPYLEQIEENKTVLENTIVELNSAVETKNAELEDLKSKLESLDQDYKTKLAGLEAIKSLREYLVSDEFKVQFKKGQKLDEEDGGQVFEPVAPQREIVFDNEALNAAIEKVEALSREVTQKENELKQVVQEKENLVGQINSLFEENQSLKNKLDVIKNKILETRNVANMINDKLVEVEPVQKPAPTSYVQPQPTYVEPTPVAPQPKPVTYVKSSNSEKGLPNLVGKLPTYYESQDIQQPTPFEPVEEDVEDKKEKKSFFGKLFGKKEKDTNDKAELEPVSKFNNQSFEPHYSYDTSKPVTVLHANDEPATIKPAKVLEGSSLSEDDDSTDSGAAPWNMFLDKNEIESQKQSETKEEVQEELEETEQKVEQDKPATKPAAKQKAEKLKDGEEEQELSNLKKLISSESENLAKQQNEFRETIQSAIDNFDELEKQQPKDKKQVEQPVDESIENGEKETKTAEEPKKRGKKIGASLNTLLKQIDDLEEKTTKKNTKDEDKK